MYFDDQAKPFFSIFTYNENELSTKSFNSLKNNYSKQVAHAVFFRKALKIYPVGT